MKRNSSKEPINIHYKKEQRMRREKGHTTPGSGSNRAVEEMHLARVGFGEECGFSRLLAQR